MQNRNTNPSSSSSNMVTENRPPCSRESTRTVNASSDPNQPAGMVSLTGSMPAIHGIMQGIDKTEESKPLHLKK